jgi:hypothetical protein
MDLFLLPIWFRLDYQQIVGPELVPGVEGSREPARGAGRKQGERHHFIGWFRALRGNDLVQLQNDLGANVELGEAVNRPYGAGADVGRLGAGGALLGHVVCRSTASRRGWARRGRSVEGCSHVFLGRGSVRGIVCRVGVVGSKGDGW